MSRKPRKPKSPEQIALEAAERRAAERLREQNLEWGVSVDTLTLAAERGEEIDHFPVRPGEREKPMRKLGGLDWLWAKGRITTIQMGAGLKYGDTYRNATDISIRSGSNYVYLGGDDVSAQQRRMESQDALKEVRTAGLVGHAELIDLCDQVAGEGRRIRDLAKGSEAVAQQKEAQLSVALDLLAKHYGMIRA